MVNDYRKYRRMFEVIDFEVLPTPSVFLTHKAFILKLYGSTIGFTNEKLNR